MLIVLWLQVAVEFPRHATIVNSVAKATAVDFAFGKRPAYGASGNDFRDLVVDDQGCCFPLAVTVDVIDADSSCCDLIAFLTLS